jgi:hypothetical protein
MAVRRIHGGVSNQEGMTIPFHSPWGQELAAFTPHLIAHPAPLVTGDLRRKGYGGNIGGMATLSASVVGITTEPGYFGDLPQSTQPIVQAHNPWERDF